MRVLVISFTDPNRDPRVSRQVSTLAGRCELVVCARGPVDDDRVTSVTLDTMPGYVDRTTGMLATSARRFERAYWSGIWVREALEKLAAYRFDVVLANDIETVPLALRLSGGQSRVMVDAHEYEPRHWDDQWLFNTVYRPYWEYICSTYLPQVDGMVSVCQRIAKEYRDRYAVVCGVILNTPGYQDLSPQEPESDGVRIIHHGGINPSRRIENMIEIVGALGSRYRLDLMLVNNHRRYMRRLRKTAQPYGNVRFVDPVPMPDIATTINRYDIGLFMLDPSGFNYRYALPNKIFEYIQARLAVAVWPSPEMARIVEDTGVGIVSDDFTRESMLAALQRLDCQQIMEYKQNADRAARTYCSDVENKKYEQLVLEGHVPPVKSQGDL